MKERANSFLRFIDRYLGIPLIIFLRIFRKKRSFPQTFDRIALLKTAGIGDTVLLSAVIQDLQKAFPGKSLTLFTGRSNYEAGLLIPGITVVALPMTQPFKALKKVREGAFDVWIDCDPWPRITALLSFFARSRFTIGFQTKGQCRHFLYDHVVSHSFLKHELENYQALTMLLKVRPEHLPYIPITQNKKPGRKVALHLFAGGSQASAKEWPKENWSELIQKLLQRDYTIVLTGSQKDHLKLQEFVVETKVQNCAGISLQETALLLLECKKVVGIDTGIVHLAAALGCSVIVLYGPTAPERWGVLGKDTVALTSKSAYKPHINLGFESAFKRNKSRVDISVDEVLQIFDHKENEK